MQTFEQVFESYLDCVEQAALYGDCPEGWSYWQDAEELATLLDLMLL